MGAGKDPDAWDAWTERMRAEHGNGNGHGKSLHIEALRMLPTPTSTDYKASGASYAATDTHHTGTTLTDAVVRGHGLMPTPSVTDVEGGRKHHSGARSGELLLNGLAAQQAFGQYAPAIARWEAVLGRPAPAPTEPTGKGGAHRLSPRFVEWLMGLPDGWVTGESVEAWRTRLADRRRGLDARPIGYRGSVSQRRMVVNRNEQLKALGNGVVPQQGAAALRHLLSVREWAISGVAA
jgi:DNA (cytosine-5)-methyltransferase 1